MTHIPLQTRLPRTVRIAKVIRETAAVTTFVFPISLGARPGQFLMAWLPGWDEVPMSIAGDDGKELRITFFAVGDTTKKLAALKEGDLVGLRGPFGTHYSWKKGQHIVLIAGGYGAAPMYFSAVEASKDGCTLDVIIGARGKEHLLYADAFRKLPKTTVHVATDDGSVGHKGYNVDLLPKILEEGKADLVFACGPERMLVKVSEVTADLKVKSQLSLERYMKCGYGLCGNCTVDPLGIRLCVEGPVVTNDVCRTIMEFGKYHRDDLGKKHEFA